MVSLVETMRMTADGLRLTANGLQITAILDVQPERGRIGHNG